MKTIVLAGGFAKRLIPTTDELPKPLLPVAGRPLLTHVLQKVDRFKPPEENRCYLTTNKKFEIDFRNYLLDNSPKIPIELISEESIENTEKRGSVGAVGLVLEKAKIKYDEVMVIGADNLFSFELDELYSEYVKRGKVSTVALFDVGDKDLAKKYGVVSIDKDNKITDFQEKPENPNSTLISTAIYMFNPHDFQMIDDYLKQGNPPDRMGDFIVWMSKRVNLQSFVFQGYWFDIGCHESLSKANIQMRGQ
ncbi:nucleotidyltransferase family protein [Candidatus Micrarchaeota archaeon]|nr:nucleotidyltransferase family protein [Candidatus Micrarchaeota archaeon]